MDTSNRRALFKALTRAGWGVRRTGGGHLQIRTPDGDVVAYTGTSPSDQRGSRRLLSDLRRAGFLWPPRSRKALASDRRQRTGGTA